MIALVDYGVGNLKSIFNAFEAFQVNSKIVTSPLDLKKADAIVMPGVGAFGDGMKTLLDRGLVEALNEEVIIKKKPFLGLCLGLQLLAKTSHEHGTHKGLGWIDACVVKMKSNNAHFKVPHMGWNNVLIKKQGLLFENIGRGPVFYFVHSYHLIPKDKSIVTAYVHHGQKMVASIEKENIFATQFHPEKSLGAGLNVLDNFSKAAKQF